VVAIEDHAMAVHHVEISTTVEVVLIGAETVVATGAEIADLQEDFNS